MGVPEATKKKVIRFSFALPAETVGVREKERIKSRVCGHVF